MITKQYLLPITLFASISIGLTACGGGGGSSAPSVEDKFDGTWNEACDYDAIELEGSKQSATINGNILTVVGTLYDTQDCSDAPNFTINIVSDLQYEGEFATGDCMAEKAKATVTALKINGASIPSNQISAFLKLRDIANPSYGLICIDSTGALRKGDDVSGAKDGSTVDKRPIAMDMSGEGAIKQ